MHQTFLLPRKINDYYYVYFEKRKVNFLNHHFIIQKEKGIVIHFFLFHPNDLYVCFAMIKHESLFRGAERQLFLPLLSAFLFMYFIFLLFNDIIS
ncbi:hypothetical protein AMD01_16895 [Priestia koreensis]|uniref:Uncharacterized protein n=1 Tax=Priestia koreensis TaxID=284581 RepID=A0A0M0KVG8_9BACI|nr:hypothetical protein AMD01_16895 [Priestia koreensis]